MAGFRGFEKSAGPATPPAGSITFGYISPGPTSPPVPTTSLVFGNSGLPQSPSPRAFAIPNPAYSPPPAIAASSPSVAVTGKNEVDENFVIKVQKRPSEASPGNLGVSSRFKTAWFQEPERTQSCHSTYPDPEVWRRSGVNMDNEPALFPVPAWGNQSKSPGDYTSHNSSSPEDAVVATLSNKSSTKEASRGSSYILQDVSKRRSLSPPRLGVRETPIFQSNISATSSARNMIANNAEDRTAGHALSKRTRSPSPADQVSQESSYHDQDETERELQAKAKRLARFKDELNEPVENVPSVFKQKLLSSRNDLPAMTKPKTFSEYSSKASGNIANDIDNEGLDSHSVIVGLCPDMCPESERAERERKADLDQYERLDGDRNQTTETLAVKKYTRTAEREAELIRPLPILQKTIDYLLNLLGRPYDDNFLGLYNFLWDRMRAIRMDLRMQHIFNLEAIAMLEQMIRLHIIAMHELCEYSKGEGFSEGFDAHLNIEQMNKTSVELFQMYDDHRKKGIYVSTEQEFRGYYALLKLDKHPGYKVEPAELSLELAKMTPEIRQTDEVLLARSVARSCRTSNFIAFFRLVRKATYLQACLMHAHFSKLRTQALAALHSGLQANQGLPVADVANWLAMQGEDIESLLEYHGFVIKDFEEPYMVKDGPFLNSNEDYPTRCSKLVHSKKSRTIAEDILSSPVAASLLTEDTEVSQSGKVNKSNHTLSTRTDASPSFVDEEMKDFNIGKTPRGSMPLSPAPRTSSIATPRVNFEVGSSPRGNTQLQHVLRTTTLAQDGASDHPSVPASSPRGTEVPPAFEVSKYSQYSSGISHLGGDDHLGTPISSPKGIMHEQPASELASNGWHSGNICQSNDIRSPHFSSQKFISGGQPAHLELKVPHSIKNDARSDFEIGAWEVDSGGAQHKLPSTSLVDHESQHSSRQDMAIEEIRGESTGVQQIAEQDEAVTSDFDEELARAKLKFLLRLWRRRFSRKRKLRDLNRLAANAALNSLSLGPSVRLNEDRRNSFVKFNIEQVMSKRFEKHDQSWSTLNVSDLVASKLCKRNANSSCICWKVVVCSHMHQSVDIIRQRDQVSHLSIDQWLHHKIMPTWSEDNDDDLIVSFSGLSIWRKWVPDQSGLTCCLSVIKDLKLSHLNESVAGANAIVFLVSESVPWGVQKIQLHDLLTSLPSGSCMPLLILYGSSEGGVLESSDTVIDKFGLHEIDKSRIRNFQVICLNESLGIGHLEGYFSDERLREGLTWLATESLPQPVVHRIKTRELVLTHLSSSVDVLVQKGVRRVGPNECISAINEALDKSIANIVCAANAHPQWPCPELALLDNYTDEYDAVKCFLPALGWSSVGKVESLVSVLRQCKLPVFSDDISWVNRGFDTIDEIGEQRLHLRDSLIRYLTQSSKIMSLELATKEASVMLQTCMRLRLHNTSYYLVSDWISIFRRAFNWQLSRLATRKFSTAYILGDHRPAPCSRVFDESGIEVTASLPCYMVHPSLDEMVEVSCSPVGPKRRRQEPITSPVRFIDSGCYSSEKPTASSCMPSDHGNDTQLGPDVHSRYRLEKSTNRLILDSEDKRKTDRLSKLLEQCNMVQNKIAEKLSIYF